MYLSDRSSDATSSPSPARTVHRQARLIGRLVAAATLVGALALAATPVHADEPADSTTAPPALDTAAPRTEDGSPHSILAAAAMPFAPADASTTGSVVAEAWREFLVDEAPALDPVATTTQTPWSGPRALAVVPNPTAEQGVAVLSALTLLIAIALGAASTASTATGRSAEQADVTSGMSRIGGAL